MSILHPRDLDKFGKLLGLLGSEHDGERAAAARKASEFLQARKLGWADITQTLKRPPVFVQPAPAAPSRSHQMDARRCLQSKIAWKPHEKDFLQQMASQLRRPSERQSEWLNGLVDRVAEFNRRQADVDY